MTQTLATDTHFLFAVHLRYEDSTVAMARPDGAGDLVGSGTGQIDGPQLHGKLRWSNFERPQPDHCQLTLVGEIDTDDSARIRFDSRGFAFPPHTGTEWKIVAAVHFVVEDARYQWLQGMRVVWAGVFDESNGTARYRAFAMEPLNSISG